MFVYFLGRCAFGIDTDMQNDINNPYLQKSAAFFKRDVEDVLMFRLSNILPILARPLHDIFFGMGDLHNMLTKFAPNISKRIPQNPALWLINKVQDVVEFRKKSSSNEKKRVDLLQLMLDASTEEQVIVS